MKYKFTEQAKNIMESLWMNIDKNIDFTPRQGTINSLGYYLSACIDSPITLLANEEYKIATGVHIWIGSNNLELDNDIKVAGFLMPRSSIKGCMLTNCVGLIDNDYQGEIIASLWNRTDQPITIKPGQKLVQLVYVFTYLPVMEFVEDFDVATVRNTNGFGSTGQ